MPDQHLDLAQIPEQLRSLPLWRGPIAVAPISGGITNRNYLVEHDGARFFARLCEPRPLLGIDRRNEVVCQLAAVDLGLAPSLVHHQDGILIIRHVNGRTLVSEDLRDPNLLSLVAGALRRLHDGWDAIGGEILYFCPFQTIRTYARTAMELGSRLPADLADLVDDSRRLSRRIRPFRPVLCHNDLLPPNMILDKGRLWLVDWEYAGMGHPLFDLASVSANAGFDTTQDERLLKAHDGSRAVEDLAQLQIFKAASLLREALWAEIQAMTSDIHFDYREYARNSFQAYREVRNSLQPD